MLMLVIGAEMTVRMRMSRPIGMAVLVLVKNNFEPPAKGVGNPAQGLQARHVIAALKPRDHRLGHAETLGQLTLGFTIARPQFQQLARAIGGNRRAVIRG
ncbi:MAG: hypothetical protein WB611_10190 [Stellaceae bacterium]